jgi:hypothetical protein
VVTSTKKTSSAEQAGLVAMAEEPQAFPTSLKPSLGEGLKVGKADKVGKLRHGKPAPKKI